MRTVPVEGVGLLPGGGVREEGRAEGGGVRFWVLG
jgi:hypothetical protein